MVRAFQRDGKLRVSLKFYKSFIFSLNGVGNKHMVDLEKIAYKPIPVRDILLELKDISELMVDLAYSSALFHSRELAEEVMELESRVDALIYILEMNLMLAARRVEDAEALVGISRIALAVDLMTNAAADIALLVLKDIGIHPIVREAFRKVGERIVRVEVKGDSDLIGMELGNVEPWVEVIAIKRGRTWIIYPDDDVKIESGDILIARGASEEVMELAEIAGDKTSELEEIGVSGAHLKAIADRLVELKNISELMIDLAYSSLLLNSRELAEEVMELEEYMDDLHTEYELQVLSSGFNPTESKDYLGLIRIGVVAEELADSAAEIAEIVLRGLKPHPVIKLVMEEADEKVVKVQVSEKSPLVGKTLKEARIPEETGMWVLAIKRNGNWIRPKPTTKIEVGDLIIASGYAEGEKDLAELASGVGF